MYLLINEVLDEITDNEEIAKPAMLKQKIKEYPALKTVLDMNFRLSFNPIELGDYSLPVGMPEGFVLDKNIPIGLSHNSIAGMARYIYVYGEKVKTERKIEIFLKDIEGLHPAEANILIHAKDGTLHYIYPWLNLETYQESLY